MRRSPPLLHFALRQQRQRFETAHLLQLFPLESLRLNGEFLQLGLHYHITATTEICCFLLK